MLFSVITVSVRISLRTVTEWTSPANAIRSEPAEDRLGALVFKLSYQL